MKEEIIKKSIGQIIKGLRQKHNISQTELGYLIDVSFQQIQKYESGKDNISTAKFITLMMYFENIEDKLEEGISKIEAITSILTSAFKQVEVD